MNLWDKIHELYNNIVISNTTCGEKWICDNDTILYKSAQYRNIFKDEESFFKDINATCYISSEYYDEYQNMLKSLFDSVEEPETIKSYLLKKRNYGFTHKNILEICNNQEEIAEYVFDLLEGENPLELLYDLVDNKYIETYDDLLVVTEDEELEDYLYNLYKQDWRNTYITDDIERQLIREYLCRERYDENGDIVKYKNLNDYIDKHGFGNIKLASFKDFIEHYYPNKEYMRYLIKKGTFLDDDEIDWSDTASLIEIDDMYKAFNNYKDTT